MELEDVFKNSIKEVIETIAGIKKKPAREIADAYFRKEYVVAKKIFASAMGIADEVGLSGRELYFDHPDIVARELIGALFLTASAGEGRHGVEVKYGVISATRSWPSAEYIPNPSMVEKFRSEPGTLFWYISPRGNILSVTAHKNTKANGPGKNQGVVTISAIQSGDELITTKQIPDFFNLSNGLDTLVNTNGVYILQRPFELAAAGYKIKETKQQPEPDKAMFTVEYELKRVRK